MRTDAAPGVWLRLTALAALGGTLAAVVSGAAHLGATHQLFAALVAPPLAALAVGAWLAHRALVPAVLGAGALFAAADTVHLGDPTRWVLERAGRIVATIDREARASGFLFPFERERGS